MLGNASEIEGGTTLHCDVCIVGAGAAGLTLASELDGSALDVVVLESGGEEVEAETQSLYRGELAGAPQYATEASRLRALGGSTGHWAGMCRPLEPFDFRPRAWVPLSGWPIDRAELEPYYTRAHPVCDLGPNDYSEQTWKPAINTIPALAAQDAHLKLIQNSKPTRFGTKFRPQMKRSRNVRVLLYSNLHELVPDPEARRIERAEVRTLDDHRFAVRARCFVLACGGIENARLLLLSNQVARRGLGNDRDWVGRCFMDHPAARPTAILLLLRRQATRLLRTQRARGQDVLIGLSLGEKLQREHRLLNNVLYVGEPRALDAFSGLSEEDRGTLRWLQRVAGQGRTPAAARCWIRSEHAPNRDSRVTLTEHLDRLGQRTIRLDWRMSDLERHTFVRSAQLYESVLAKANLARARLAPWLLRDDERDWWSHLSPGNHHIGTTRMASDPSQGVVDADCRMFGVDNFYVAGSSVFPTAGFMNPTLTIVALTLRLADHLKTRFA